MASSCNSVLTRGMLANSSIDASLSAVRLTSVLTMVGGDGSLLIALTGLPTMPFARTVTEKMVPAGRPVTPQAVGLGAALMGERVRSKQGAAGLIGQTRRM